MSLLRRRGEPRARGEVGWFEIDVPEGVELSRGPWFEFHFDACSLPERAELWATSPHAVQAFGLGPHVGVQFHPEVDDAQLKEWLATDVEGTRELGFDVAALLDQTARETPAARVRAQGLVDLFLRRVSESVGSERSETTFDVRVERPASGGGVGRAPDGRVIFVRYALPGELVRVDVNEATSSFYRGDAVDVLEASPERVTPPCPYFIWWVWRLRPPTRVEASAARVEVCARARAPPSHRGS